MPEVRYDSADAEAAVRAFVRRAAAATEVPAPFELAGALRAGRRRVARRRVSAVAGAAALAAAVGAIAVLPTLEEPSGAPIPGESRTPAPSDEPREGLSTHASIEELVSRPYTAIGDTQFAGLAVSATMIRGCDKDLACDSVVLLTSDGWRSNVAHVVPGAGYVRTQLLPDGSVAFVPDQRVDTDAEPGVLHPDGRVSPLHVSTEPGFPTAGSVLTVEPLLDEPSFVPWVVDPDRATLRPLRTRPKGDRTGPPVVAADGTVFVTSFDVGGTPARVAIARSRDGGRTWDYSQVTARTPAATLAGYQAIRPD
ncbi:MAG: hypothetical protein ACRDV2_03125, partial [Actinomycetes bacterium]